jgi:hypothetical protein
MPIRMRNLQFQLTMLINVREQLQKLKALRKTVKELDRLGEEIVPGRLLDKIANALNDETLTLDKKVAAVIRFENTPELTDVTINQNDDS